MRIDRDELGRRTFLVSLLAVLASACVDGAETAGTPEPVPTAVPPTTVPPTGAPTAAPVPTAVPSTAVSPTAVPPTAVSPTARASAVPEIIAADSPFTLGVASGDPTSDAVILWTRLLPATPLSGPVAVSWEVAEDDGFDEVVARGDVTIDAPYVAHIDATGLRPDTWYAYRFRHGEHESPVGWTRTTPLTDAESAALTFAFSSCQRRPSGEYAAHRALAEAGQDIDLFFWLGDYIYEDGSGGSELLPDRAHTGGTAQTLEQYRARYAQYKSDEHLQAHHAARPWVVTWDDHEVTNDYTSGVDPARRAAAYQAWYEHMPVRLPPPDGATPWVIHRDVRWGQLAHFFVLDSRQYRDPQPTSDQEAATTDASILGTEQEAWLVAGASASDAAWTVLAQQTLMSGLTTALSGPPQTTFDAWDGYRTHRETLLQKLADQQNLVVISGDFHLQVAADLRPDPFDLDSPIIGAELMAGAISSQFPSDLAALVPFAPLVNPHIRHIDVRNGFVVCDVGPDSVQARFQTVENVFDAASPVGRIASAVITDGVPGVQLVP